MEENLTTPPIIDVTNINEKIYDYIKKNQSGGYSPEVKWSLFPCLRPNEDRT